MGSVPAPGRGRYPHPPPIPPADEQPAGPDAAEEVLRRMFPPPPADRPADPRDRALALAYWQARGVVPPWADADLTPADRLGRLVAGLAADVRELAAAVARLEGRCRA